jgi:tetratricopeptide (TPR) repeat protein
MKTPVYDIQIPVDLLHEGKADEAIPILEFIAQSMPCHVTAHVLLAQAYIQKERWEEAKLAWQNAAFLMPNSPSIRKGFRHAMKVLSQRPVKPPAPPEPVEVSTPEAEARAEGNTEGRGPGNTYAPPLPPVVAGLSKQGDLGEDEELDNLIQELESARIVPKPEHESIESPVLETDIEDMVSETLARIFEGQKQFDEAARVYDRLATLQPERAEDYNQKASDLRARAANESD